MVARLTPDQKAACSTHVGVNHFFSCLPFQRTWIPDSRSNYRSYYKLEIDMEYGRFPSAFRNHTQYYIPSIKRTPLHTKHCFHGPEMFIKYGFNCILKLIRKLTRRHLLHVWQLGNRLFGFMQFGNAHMIPWCSGYHICLTRRRSWVRAPAESSFEWLHKKSSLASKFLSLFAFVDSNS